MKFRSDRVAGAALGRGIAGRTTAHRTAGDRPPHRVVFLESLARAVPHLGSRG